MDFECICGLFICRKTLFGDSVDILEQIYTEKKDFLALCNSDYFIDWQNIPNYNPITCTTNNPERDFCQISKDIVPTGKSTCEIARRMDTAIWSSVVLSSILLLGWTLLIVKIARSREIFQRKKSKMTIAVLMMVHKIFCIIQWACFNEFFIPYTYFH